MQQVLFHKLGVTGMGQKVRKLSQKVPGRLAEIGLLSDYEWLAPIGARVLPLDKQCLFVIQITSFFYCNEIGLPYDVPRIQRRVPYT
jgi:hypothetical protein